MFHHLKMGHKLWLAVAAIVVLLVGVVGFSGYRSAATRAQSPSSRRPWPPPRRKSARCKSHSKAWV